MTEKRKRTQEFDEIEVDVDKSEPLSRKETRRRKKLGLPLDGALEVQPDKKIEVNKESNHEKDSHNKPKSEFGIWIGNLAFKLDKDDVRKLFTEQSNGTIKDADILRIHMRKSPGGFNKGFAYVDFATQQQMNSAISISETLFSGRKVLIKSAKSFEGRPEQQRSSLQNSESDKPRSAYTSSTRPPHYVLFIGNLPFETTEQDLTDLFTVDLSGQDLDRTQEETITPNRVRMATFQDSGKCKGFAFIDYSSIELATKVLQTLGSSIRFKGRTNVSITYGQDRSKRFHNSDHLPDPHSSSNNSDSPRQQRRIAPGLALANTQRGKSSIVPSLGKKVKFDD
ncbi:uncharacterized protein V1516DRAFT_213429 [Lipomyces oligophaga]|uniref:uncharacterized protein n=1 Tax=Lipomyces oligophaga TaxID=45792 RepID=UPI0034CF8B99